LLTACVTETVRLSPTDPSLVAKIGFYNEGMGKFVLEKGKLFL
jgi:hypothetical protein